MLTEDVKINIPLVLTPEEIAEYIHEEFTPYSQMSLEDGKKHLAELIRKYGQWREDQVICVVTVDE